MDLEAPKSEEQQPDGSTTTRKDMIRCRTCRRRGHKRIQCPGMAKAAKRACKERKQCNKKRKAKHQGEGKNLKKPREASPLPPQYSLRSNASKMNKNYGKGVTTTLPNRFPEGKHKEETTTTVRNRHQKPQMNMCFLFASPATDRATKPMIVLI